jgi:hypothetical protein
MKERKEERETGNEVKEEIGKIDCTEEMCI